MTDPSNVQAPPPAVLEAVQRWGLTLGDHAGSRYSHTWFATRDGEHVVIKVGGAGARGREAAALDTYRRGAAAMGLAHSPACLVLAEAVSTSSPGEVALLLERVLPGFDLRPLARRDDDAATVAIGQVIAALHATAATSRSDQVSESGDPRTGAHALLELASIAEAFDPPRRHAVWAVGQPAPGLQPGLVDLARVVLAELTVASAHDTVLHGDLHHANVVCDGGPAWRGQDQPERTDWRAIDPHGWVGDPHFDAVSMLLDLHGTTQQSALSDAELLALTRRRCAILADVTGLDAGRMQTWTMVGAVISELWCLADHGFVQGPPQRLAALLAQR